MVEINFISAHWQHSFTTFILFRLTSSVYCFSQDYIVRHVNDNWKSGRGSWVADKYPFQYPGLDEKHLTDAKYKHNGNDYLIQALRKESEKLQLPYQFDARKKWPHCETMYDIADQGMTYDFQVFFLINPKHHSNNLWQSKSNR